MAIIDELTDLKSATLNSIAQAADTSELEAVRVSVLEMCIRDSHDASRAEGICHLGLGLCEI